MVDHDIYFYKLCITNISIYTLLHVAIHLLHFFFKTQANVLITLKKNHYLCLNVKADTDSVTGVLYPLQKKLFIKLEECVG